MVFLKRRRLIFWLFRAYLKKWGRSILASFILGVFAVAVLYLGRNVILSRIPLNKTENIGIAGIYSKQDLPNNLPETIQEKTSRGLTKIDPKGNVQPDLAKSWDIKDNGKTYVFYLKPGIYFSDGTAVDSKSINYNFSDVVIERPAESVIVFKLKEKYSPFLVTLANHKVFKKNYIGVSDYEISSVKINGGFIDYIELYSKKEKKVIKYDFYDTQSSLKSAYVLGEVNEAVGITDPSYGDLSNLLKFNNTTSLREVNYNEIVTVFFNNIDPLISDKKVRKALAYSLPNTFSEGSRAYTPYNRNYWFNNPDVIYKQDFSNAKSMLEGSDSSKSANLTIDLKTLPQYRKEAGEIASDWKKIGINTKIEIVDSVPSVYQAFLGELPLIKDPDQYTLWHSAGASNITNYKNLRIDKLLEDGRQTYDKNQRKQIYDDFQKYLIDDMPAAFLYYPYSYTLIRK